MAGRRPPSFVRAVRALVALVSAGALAASLGAAPAQAKAPKPKWKISWRAEFTGTGVPNPKIWNAHNGNGINGYGHQALQYYDPANARLNGKGQLVLTAEKKRNGQTCWNGPCQYTSGRVDTRDKFAHGYGRFVARIKIPTGVGLWPAFWMQTVEKKPSRYAEIDVVETIGNEPNRVQGFAHTAKGKVATASKLLNKPLSAGYHTYAVEWTSTGIVWKVDGKRYGYLKKYKNWPFDTRMFMILNLQVGGEWPGPPNAQTKFPKRMTVDWIRIYKRA
ncbi:glycoside hydrolase family 16 protein [Actinocorallia sp. API 0066]|uniref:glycoside hydrolase family 16 protein n=1 Tax=Actinocorallia sp. API 0066 TaxID=2896846 RepID=UPI001E2CA870|nr:glycoside hydrolase family 16 protein [Actinocorallia sp. API 0066]MCD0450130.1 glycoside hydrolase family 16 protein [Actinocorallia sp. API 0066]